MAVKRFMQCLEPKEYKKLMRIAKKHFRGNRAATIAAGVDALDEKIKKESK